jgi:hypothetical protein
MTRLHRSLPTSIRHKRHALAALLPLLAAGHAAAGELTFGAFSSGLGQGQQVDLGAAQLTVKGAVQVGAVARASSAHHVGAYQSMTTLDDGDLNYGRNDLVSSALESWLQADLRAGDAGVFVSGKAWYDNTLKNGKVAHGSSVTGYKADSPLSDKGFVPLDRFANAVLADAYAYDTLHLSADASVLGRLGYQAIPWVTPTTIGGGLQQVNAVDYSALARASSIAEEATIPAPALYTRLQASKQLTFDAYYQARFVANAYPGCGTFWSTSDYAQQGCNKMTLNGAVLSALTGKSVQTSDAVSAANPLDYVARTADVKSRTKGQYGASTTWLVDGVGLFGLYYATYSHRSSFTSITHNSAGVLTPVAANVGLATPTGLAASFARVFPTDIHMFGLNFKTRLPDGTGAYGELTYRPNQPIGWNGADFAQGVLAGKGPLAYLQSTAAGYFARGYDNFKVTQLNLGAQRPLGQFGGNELTLSAEAALKHVAGLPNAYDMRYGRVGWGAAPSSSNPTCTSDAQTCRLDGFVTSNAWGLRAKLDDRIQNVVDGLDINPSLSLAWDAHGYSYDGIFAQGRKTAIAEVKANWRRSWTFAASFVKTGGGTYNIVDDRSFYSASAGYKF